MKVLFAMASSQKSKSIADRYYDKYGETLEYKDIFYFKALLDEVKRDKSYNVIVINEEMEQYKAKDIEQIDRKLFSYVDSVTDEAQDADIIYICSDRRTKDDQFIVRLYSIGIYNILLGDDRNINSLCEIIKKPKTKREAKMYLNIDSGSINETGIMRDDEVDETQMMNILNYYDKIKDQPEKYVETFDRIYTQYSHTQLKVIASWLPKEVQDVLYKEARYKFLLSFDGSEQSGVNPESRPVQSAKKVERKHSQDFFGVFKKSKDKLINNLSHKNEKTQRVDKYAEKKLELEEQAKKEAEAKRQQELEEQTRKEAEVKRQQELEETAKKEAEAKRQQELAEQAEKEAEEKRQQELAKQAEKEAELKRRQELEEQAKKEAEEKAKREAALKEAEDQIIVDVIDNTAEEKAKKEAEAKLQEELEEKAKKEAEVKLQKELAEQAKKEAEEKAQQELAERAKKEAEEKAQQELAERAKKEAEEKLQAELAEQAQKEAEEKLQKELEEQAKKEAIEDARIKEEEQRLKEEQEKIKKVQAELEEEKRKLREEQERLANEKIQLEVMPQMRENTATYEMATVTPLNYKKVVAFVGANKAGTSFMVNAVAQNLANQKVLTSILDMTKDKSMYYIYNQGDKALRKIAKECMQRIAEGEDYYIPVSKHLKVYTTIPGGIADSRRGYKHKQVLETVKNNANVVIVDADFTTPIDYFDNASEIYIIQDMDILKMQETTMFLREMKNRNVDMSKIKIIINKYVKNMLTPKKIIESLCYYKDPEMTFIDTVLTNKVPYSVIPYNLNNYTKYTESLCKGVVSFKGYSTDFMEAVNEITSQIYSKGGDYKKRRGGLFG